MPEIIPNLAGVASKDLVETIGAGSFKASYINWARTFNLLHEHAPGWYLDMVLTAEGEQVWAAPGNGGSLMLRFCHIDGTCLAPVPQAIMDHRNNPIPIDKISARDVTDTHRRGGCMAAAMTFGLAHELWAKMPLESGYAGQEGAPVVAGAATPAEPPVAPLQAAAQPTQKDFLEACLDKGLTTFAADNLLELVAGNYAGGLKTLASKSSEWVAEQNAKAEPAPKSQQKKTTKSGAKPDPSEY